MGSFFFTLIFPVIAIAGAAVQLARSREPRTLGHASEVFLVWFLVVWAGIGSVFTFLSHTLLADPTARSIGWLIGNPDAPTVMAPRFSVLFPTGDDKFERGTGGVSYQANLPLTLVLGPAFTTHWNAGATLSPNAHNTLGAQATHWRKSSNRA